MILYGSGMSNSNVHAHDQLPILIAGGAAGKLKGDRHIKVKNDTPLSNLLDQHAGQGRRADRSLWRQLGPYRNLSVSQENNDMRILWAMLAVSAVSVFAAPDLRVLEAAKNQDSAALRSLVKQKLDVNAADVDGMTALIWAAHNNDLDAVKALLAAGANAKAANRYEVTALSEAANSGNGAMIEALVKAGADVNAPFGEGETPLMTASRTGSVAGVKALLAAGAKVNATDSYRGQTALMWAVAENHAEVAKLLVDAKADVNVRSTLFDFAFRKVAAGGTQAVYSRGGLTALMLAARQGSIEMRQDSARRRRQHQCSGAGLRLHPAAGSDFQRPLRSGRLSGRSQSQPQGRRALPGRRNAQSGLPRQPSAQSRQR